MSLYETGTITGALNSTTISGTGTKWSDAKIGITNGSVLFVSSSAGMDGVYQVKRVINNTSIELAQPIYKAFTHSKYSILVAEASSTASFANQLAAALGYYQAQIDGWQQIMTGTGDVELTAPDGTKVTIRSFKDKANSGVNSDITELKGLTKPLSLKQGGTGAIDAAKAKSNLGLGSTDVVTFGHMNLERYDDSNVSASGILNLMNYNTDGSVRKARARIYEEIRQDGKHWLTLHLQVGDTNQYWGFQDNGNFNSPKGMSTIWMKTLSDGEGYVNMNSGPNQPNYIIGKNSDASNIWYLGKGSAANNNVQLRNYVGDCSLGVLENGNVELLTKGNKGEVGFTGGGTKLYSGSANRNWRNQISNTPAKDLYNRFWGTTGRPCVFEVGFDSTYCTYTQINTDGSILFNVNGNITCKTLTQTSDIALKDNIVAIDNALDKISQLNGYTFTWKDSGLPSAGVIAQEVMEVLPEIISTTRDEAGSNSPSNEGDASFEQTDEGSRHYAVEYSGLIGLLISGINEERRNREEMEIKVTALQERLTSLEEIFDNLPLNKAPTQS